MFKLRKHNLRSHQRDFNIKRQQIEFIELQIQNE